MAEVAKKTSSETKSLIAEIQELKEGKKVSRVTAQQVVDAPRAVVKKRRVEDKSKLDLGWAQHYFAFKYHLEEAAEEAGKAPPCGITWNPPFAIFSRKYYSEIQVLKSEKVHDYCFIGSIESCKERRLWVLEFAKTYFTEKSIFVNTDGGNWKSLGSFDLTGKQPGFCPKSQKDNQSKQVQYRRVRENLFYFTTMRQSKFCLCPAGDSSWSFRFYEILMCGSIPVVETWHHTYRTPEESKLDYRYLLFDEDHTYTKESEEMVKHNTRLFEKHHLLALQLDSVPPVPPSSPKPTGPVKLPELAKEKLVPHVKLEWMKLRRRS